MFGGNAPRSRRLYCSAPGMEGGRPEKYDVLLFAPNIRRTYMSFISEQSV